MSNAIKRKISRQPDRNTSLLSPDPKEQTMGNSNSDESNSVDFYDFGKREEEFAARFLSRALDELGLANSNVSDCDLQVFAGTLIREMGLLIGSEEFLRERFTATAQNLRKLAKYASRPPPILNPA